MRGAIRSAALLLFFVCTSGAAAAQPPKDATLRVTVLDQSGAIIPAAHVTLQPVDPPGAPQERSTDERGEATFTNLPPGRYTIRGEFAGFEPRQIDDLRLRTGASRRELRLPIARHAEDVQVGQDGRERALDPRSGAFATVLSKDQIDALPDDPDEMEAALKEMAGPRRRDPRRRFSRRQAAAEIADPRHPLPSRFVRGGEPRRRPRVRGHHDQSRRRTPSGHGGLHLSRRVPQRAKCVLAGAQPGTTAELWLHAERYARQESHVVLADEQRHELLRFTDDLRGDSGRHRRGRGPTANRPRQSVGARRSRVDEGLLVEGDVPTGDGGHRQPRRRRLQPRAAGVLQANGRRPVPLLRERPARPQGLHRNPLPGTSPDARFVSADRRACRHRTRCLHGRRRAD